MKSILMAVALLTSMIFSVAQATTCDDFTGSYLTSRGSSEDGGTVITQVLIKQTGCNTIEWTFNYPDGNQQVKKLIIDGKERLSYDDGYVVLWDSARFEENKLIIDTRMLQRSENIVTKSTTMLFKESRGGHIVENKKIMTEEGGRIGNVITSFIKR